MALPQTQQLHAWSPASCLSAQRPAVQQRTPRSRSSVSQPRGAAIAARGVTVPLARERTGVAFDCCNGWLASIKSIEPALEILEGDYNGVA